MKFLIDENIGRSVIQYIKGKNYDTVVAKEEFTGRDDIFLIKKAFKENRIIITNDKDFGYLCFKTNYPTAGTILFRLKEENPEKKVKMLDYLLTEKQDNIYNYFIVISDNKIRFRRIR